MIHRNALPVVRASTRFSTRLSTRLATRVATPLATRLATLLATTALVAAAMALFQSPAHAQSAASYPDKPVRIIVPFPPGGAADTFARLAGQKLSEAWGNKQVIIENRAGAGGIIGTEATAKAPADGYTFEMVTIGHAVNPSCIPSCPTTPRRS